MRRYETQALVIGGGATGCGVLRDLSLRGISAILIERDDISSGATGGNHGLLHSGARYAVRDPESAKECIHENRILRKIARHCVEPTGGLFVGLPGDDPSYYETFRRGCRSAGIDCEPLSIKEALRIEPNLNPEIVSALRVPDGAIDPFRLTSANVLDAQEHGGTVLLHTEVTGFIMEGSRVAAVLGHDRLKHEPVEIRAQIVINAAAAWGKRICAMAGVDLPLTPSKGSLIIMDYRVNGIVVNRLRTPGDADIVVPGDTVSLIGTTSLPAPDDELDRLTITDREIDALLNEGSKLIPSLRQHRILRSFCGVRPLIAAAPSGDGRNVSRGIVCIDHRKTDGIENLITITGGKLMTYRLMAQQASGLVSEKLGLTTTCTTSVKPLPGSEKKHRAGRNRMRAFSGIANSVVGSTIYRHGERVFNILSKEKKNYRLICECEMVTAGEVEYAIQHLNVKDILDLRKRTRIGMGPCQGELCSYRAAGLFTEYAGTSGEEAAAMLRAYLEERFRGVKPVLWGDALKEIEFTYWIYQDLMGLGSLEKDGVSQ
jgi:glycerol-3-phosphate dehydrogenase